jgi:hypothetical protein
MSLSHLVRLLTLLLLLVLTAQAAKKPDYFKDWKARKLECSRRSSCLLDESENCVNRCISAVCYAQLYKDWPLEDGEIDKSRSREFMDCVKQEEKDRRIARLG